MKYESNIQNVIVRLEGKLKKLEDISGLQRNIATYLYAENWNRVRKGISVGGRKIGRYNTNKGLYVNPTKAKRSFPVGGKYGQKKFLNGKPHRTAYFKGYFNFKKTVGYTGGADIVNLELTGKLRLDWQMIQSGKDWMIGFNSVYGSQVSRGNERKFNVIIFGISQKDRQQIKIIENDFVKECLK